MIDKFKGLVAHVRGGVNMARLLATGKGSGADYVMVSICIGVGVCVGMCL